MIDTLADKIPANLWLSISTLKSKFAETESILVGLLVNLSLAASGVAIVLLVSNPVLSLIGAAWAIINLVGIISWVFGL